MNVYKKSDQIFRQNSALQNWTCKTLTSTVYALEQMKVKWQMSWRGHLLKSTRRPPLMIQVHAEPVSSIRLWWCKIFWCFFLIYEDWCPESGQACLRSTSRAHMRHLVKGPSVFCVFVRHYNLVLCLVVASVLFAGSWSPPPPHERGSATCSSVHTDTCWTDRWAQMPGRTCCSSRWRSRQTGNTEKQKGREEFEFCTLCRTCFHHYCSSTGNKSVQQERNQSTTVWSTF